LRREEGGRFTVRGVGCRVKGVGFSGSVRAGSEEAAAPSKISVKTCTVEV